MYFFLQCPHYFTPKANTVTEQEKHRTVDPSVSRSNNWVNGCSAALTLPYIAARCDVTNLTNGTRRGQKDNRDLAAGACVVPKRKKEK